MFVKVPHQIIFFFLNIFVLLKILVIIRKIRQD